VCGLKKKSHRDSGSIKYQSTPAVVTMTMSIVVINLGLVSLDSAVWFYLLVTTKYREKREEEVGFLQVYVRVTICVKKTGADYINESRRN